MSYVLYASGHRAPDLHPRAYVPVIHSAARAAAWLSFFLNGQEFTREDDTLCMANGYSLRCCQLDELMAINDGTITDEDRRQILRFKYGTWEEVHTKDPVDTPAAPRRERNARAHKPDDYVTITELCAASGVPACDARALLRASGRDKPPYGWAFAPSELGAIKKLIGIG